MFTRRMTLIISVLLAIGLAVLGASMLFAAGDGRRYDTNDSGLIEAEEAYQAIQDHYSGTLTQEQTIDVLLRFWGDIPVEVGSQAAPPAPVATSTPTPLPTPTPKPVPLGIQLSNAFGNGCVGHEEFPSPDNHSLTSETASDIRLAAMFKNPREPDHEPWEEPEPLEFWYGFMARSVPDQGVGLLVLVSADKTWSVELRKNLSGYRYEARYGTEYENDRAVRTFRQGWGGNAVVVLGSGTLEAFNAEAGETNHVMFEVEGSNYRLAVNGQDMDLDIDAETLETVEEYIGKYRHLDDGKWHGHYNVTYFSRTPLLRYGYATAWTGGTYEEIERTTEPRTVTRHSPYPWVACKP